MARGKLDSECSPTRAGTEEARTNQSGCLGATNPAGGWETADSINLGSRVQRAGYVGVAHPTSGLRIWAPKLNNIQPEKDLCHLLLLLFYTCRETSLHKVSDLFIVHVLLVANLGPDSWSLEP